MTAPDQYVIDTHGLTKAYAGLAVAATVLALPIPARQAGSGVAMTIAGLMGAVAMSFFYINTYYFAALPLWILAAGFRVAIQVPSVQD